MNPLVRIIHRETLSLHMIVCWQLVAMFRVGQEALFRYPMVNVPTIFGDSSSCEYFTGSVGEGNITDTSTSVKEYIS